MQQILKDTQTGLWSLWNKLNIQIASATEVVCIAVQQRTLTIFHHQLDLFHALLTFQ